MCHWPPSLATVVQVCRRQEGGAAAFTGAPVPACESGCGLGQTPSKKTGRQVTNAQLRSFVLFVGPRPGMVLPKGVEPSADPLIAARSAPYAVGLGRRLGEGAKQ